MDLKYHYINIGGLLANKIKTESVLNYEDLAIDFIKSLKRFSDDKDYLQQITRKLAMEELESEVLSWFLETRLLKEFSVLYNLQIRYENCVIRFNAYRNAHKLKDNCRVSVPKTNITLPIHESDFSHLSYIFININSIVSSKPGYGKKALQKFINTYNKYHILLAVGYLFVGDYDYNNRHKDNNLVNKLCKYYKDIDFIDINDDVGEYFGQVTMIHFGSDQYNRVISDFANEFWKKT